MRRRIARRAAQHAYFLIPLKLKRHVGCLIRRPSGCDTRRTLFDERLPMSDFFSKSGATRGVLAALLIGSAVGAGAASLAISGSSFAATTPPISVTPSNPQPGFS